MGKRDSSLDVIARSVEGVGTGEWKRWIMFWTSHHRTVQVFRRTDP